MKFLEEAVSPNSDFKFEHAYVVSTLEHPVKHDFAKFLQYMCNIINIPEKDITIFYFIKISNKNENNKIWFEHIIDNNIVNEIKILTDLFVDYLEISGQKNNFFEKLYLSTLENKNIAMKKNEALALLLNSELIDPITISET